MSLCPSRRLLPRGHAPTSAPQSRAVRGQLEQDRSRVVGVGPHSWTRDTRRETRGPAFQVSWRQGSDQAVQEATGLPHKSESFISRGWRDEAEGLGQQALTLDFMKRTTRDPKEGQELAV